MLERARRARQPALLARRRRRPALQQQAQRADGAHRGPSGTRTRASSRSRSRTGRASSGVVELGERGRRRDVQAPASVAPRARAVGGRDLASYVGTPLTLLWAEAHAVDRGYRGGTVSLVSRASLERLREEAGADGPVDGRRFRMLFEIDGVAAHEEDEWLGTQVRVGEATIVLNGDVGRCVVTSHDPDTGVTDLDTLGALARYRRERPERAAAVRRLRRGRRSRPRPRRRRGAAAAGPAARRDIAISAMLARDGSTRESRRQAAARTAARADRHGRPRLVLREHRREGRPSAASR